MSDLIDSEAHASQILQPSLRSQHALWLHSHEIVEVPWEG